MAQSFRIYQLEINARSILCNSISECCNGAVLQDLPVGIFEWTNFDKANRVEASLMAAVVVMPLVSIVA